MAALFAAGIAGVPGGFRPPTDTDVLAARRIELTSPAERSEAYERALARYTRAAELAAAPAEELALAAEPLPPGAGIDPLPVERPIVAPPSFPTRPVKRAARQTRTATVAGPKEAGVWAVSVGIDDYPGQDGDLRAAAADARGVDAALAAYGIPGHRRVLLLDHNATAANIRDALRWLVARASSDATVVFFYSGHVRLVSGDPDGDGEDVDEAIVGADGEHVFDGDLAHIFKSLESRSVWIGMAACYGSGFDDALAPGRVLTAAAAERDVAYENSALGHSYLVEYMVRRAMLQGKAPGSVQDAFAWARAQIARDYPNRQPVMVDRSGGPLVLGAHNNAPAQASPPAPEPGPSPEPESSPSSPPPASPAPSEPSQPPEDPGSGGCAAVFGVTVCSADNSSQRTSGWRRAV